MTKLSVIADSLPVSTGVSSGIGSPISAHEIVDLIRHTSQPSYGLTWSRLDAPRGNHLEPFLMWKTFVRGEKIEILKGLFSGRWEICTEEDRDSPGDQLAKEICFALEAVASSPDEAMVLRQLEACDIHGCPLGRQYWC
jgi:hypothetical protein